MNDKSYENLDESNTTFEMEIKVQYNIRHRYCNICDCFLGHKPSVNNQLLSKERKLLQFSLDKIIYWIDIYKKQ